MSFLSTFANNVLLLKVIAVIAILMVLGWVVLWPIPTRIKAEVDTKGATFIIRSQESDVINKELDTVSIHVADPSHLNLFTDKAEMANPSTFNARSRLYKEWKNLPLKPDGALKYSCVDREPNNPCTFDLESNGAINSEPFKLSSIKVDPNSTVSFVPPPNENKSDANGDTEANKRESSISMSVSVEDAVSTSKLTFGSTLWLSATNYYLEGVPVESLYEQRGESTFRHWLRDPKIPITGKTQTRYTLYLPPGNEKILFSCGRNTGISISDIHFNELDAREITNIPYTTNVEISYLDYPDHKTDTLKTNPFFHPMELEDGFQISEIKWNPQNNVFHFSISGTAGSILAKDGSTSGWALFGTKNFCLTPADILKYHASFNHLWWVLGGVGGSAALYAFIKFLLKK